jgi:hypothetical protein
MDEKDERTPQLQRLMIFWNLCETSDKTIASYLFFQASLSTTSDLEYSQQSKS